MSETEDLPPVIAVNWDAVEEIVGHSPGADRERRAAVGMSDVSVFDSVEDVPEVTR